MSDMKLCQHSCCFNVTMVCVSIIHPVLMLNVKKTLGKKNNLAMNIMT